jgi:predicted alpha/beta-fold hydrolase
MRTTTTLLTRRVAAALVPRPRPVAAAAAAARAASYLATSEAGTAALAAALASAVSAPLAVCLYGDVGAGKSAFARAWVRAAAGDGELPVPSPTYLLHNVYDDVDGERGREREGGE